MLPSYVASRSRNQDWSRAFKGRYPPHICSDARLHPLSHVQRVLAPVTRDTEMKKAVLQDVGRGTKASLPSNIQMKVR